MSRGDEMINRALLPPPPVEGTLALGVQHRGDVELAVQQHQSPIALCARSAAWRRWSSVFNRAVRAAIPDARVHGGDRTVYWRTDEILWARLSRVVEENGATTLEVALYDGSTPLSKRHVVNAVDLSAWCSQLKKIKMLDYTHSIEEP